MVFSRIVVSSLFLVTVIAVPVSIPDHPGVAETTVQISVAARVEPRPVEPAPVAAPTPAELVERLADSDPVARRAAFDSLVAVSGHVPEMAAGRLAGLVATDAFAAEGLLAIGAPAASHLASRLQDADPRVRAASAAVLARLAPATWSGEIIPAALASLSRNSVAGDARLGVLALISCGSMGAAAARPLLRSSDDQAVAAAVIVLVRTGGIAPVELDLAVPSLRRLALRWPAGGDEPEAAIEALAALGPGGEAIIRSLGGPPPGFMPVAAVRVWKACADPGRAPWTPAGRRPNLPELVE